MSHTLYSTGVQCARTAFIGVGRTEVLRQTFYWSQNSDCWVVVGERSAFSYYGYLVLLLALFYRAVILSIADRDYAGIGPSDTLI